jgi:hypothetical protein
LIILLLIPQLASETYQFNRTVVLEGKDVPVSIKIRERRWPLWKRDSKFWWHGQPDKYLEELSVSYSGWTITVAYPQIIAEDPNIQNDLRRPATSFPYYFLPVGAADKLVIRILAGDGAYSHVCLLFMEQGKLLSSESMQVEEYLIQAGIDTFDESEIEALKRLARTKTKG